jgi:hypothetical protein
MNEVIRVYYYFIFGALGGVTGWMLTASVLTRSAQIPTIQEQAAFGAFLGAAIGLGIAAYEGLISRSPLRFVKFGGIGLLLGIVAGGLALPAAQWLYQQLLRPQTRSGAATLSWESVVVGTLCWIIFGGLIGFVESLHKGTQSVKGLAGGVLGGLIGGLIYEFARALGITNTASFEQQRVLAVTLALLGGAIGASIAFVAIVLKQAWVEVVDGKFAGRKYDLTKYMYVDRKRGKPKTGIIGSDEWSANVYLPADGEILSHHAQIGSVNGVPTLSVFPEAEKVGTTLVNGKKGKNWHLKDGDRLQVGSTLLIYHHKRK